MSSREIYLDYAATAPLDPAVGVAMSDCMAREFGNPSSQHAAGRRARALVEAARVAVAARVGAPMRAATAARAASTSARARRPAACCDDGLANSRSMQSRIAAPTAGSSGAVAA